jgi:pimeloyl-ACP methyl ester carboxylesterase
MRRGARVYESTDTIWNFQAFHQEKAMATGFGYGKLDQPEVLSVMFHPRQEAGIQAPAGAMDYDIVVEDGIHVGARFFMADKANPNILFFHGNGEIVEDYNEIGPIYNASGLNFLPVDYRGYGRSLGNPTASAMMGDAHTIFREVTRWLKDNGYTGPLIVMGRSLGTACAIELMVSFDEDIAGLIIESGFAQTVSLLNTLGVDAQALGITEAEGFKNIQKIEQVTKPTLQIHGRYDQIIPAMSAELLQVHCAARGKEFHIIPGADHNTILVHGGKFYFELIKRFTNKIEGKREKRYFRKKPKITS